MSRVWRHGICSDHPKAWSVMVYQASQWPWLTHEPLWVLTLTERRHRSLMFSARKYICRILGKGRRGCQGSADAEVLVNIFLSQQPVLHRFFPESYRCSLFSGHPNLQNHHDVPLHLAEFPLWANSMSSSALFGICFLGFYVDLANVFRHWPFLCLLSQCCS